MTSDHLSGIDGFEADLDLVGVYAKIRRARHNLQTFESDIKEFCESEREKILGKLDQLPPLVVYSANPELLADYSARVGEIAYNLRSALDHLVWQLIWSNHELPTNHSEFPIFNCGQRYLKASSRKLKGMGPHHAALIEGFQPYHRGCAIGQHLWMLHLIGNIDKHRYLNPIDLSYKADAHLQDDSVPSHLTYGLTSGLGLQFLLRGTGYEGHVEKEVVTSLCFRTRELQLASPGYGSTMEKAGVGGPPVTLVLSSCLVAVSEVVREARETMGGSDTGVKDCPSGTR